jgi:hypothetical protein
LAVPVHIEQLTSTVHVTDSAAPLSADALRQIVAAVIAAIDARAAREERGARDRRVDGPGPGGER